MKFILDTSALIELIDKRPKGESIIQKIGNERALASSISIFEILSNSSPRVQLVAKGLFRNMETLPFTLQDAEESSAVLRELNKNGTPINKLDIMIAGACLTQDATLVTLDKDFRRISRLKILEV